MIWASYSNQIFSLQDFQANFITSAKKRPHCLIGQNKVVVQQPFPAWKGLWLSGNLVRTEEALLKNKDVSVILATSTLKIADIQVLACLWLYSCSCIADLYFYWKVSFDPACTVVCQICDNLIVCCTYLLGKVIC